MFILYTRGQASHDMYETEVKLTGFEISYLQFVKKKWKITFWMISLVYRKGCNSKYPNLPPMMSWFIRNSINRNPDLMLSFLPEVLLIIPLHGRADQLYQHTVSSDSC